MWPEHRRGSREAGAAAPLQAIRWLAALTVLLALGAFGLAAAWSREHAEALCWRAAAEDNDIPAEGDCHRPLRLGALTVLP